MGDGGSIGVSVDTFKLWAEDPSLDCCPALPALPAVAYASPRPSLLASAVDPSSTPAVSSLAQRVELVKAPVAFVGPAFAPVAPAFAPVAPALAPALAPAVAPAVAPFAPAVVPHGFFSLAAVAGRVLQLATLVAE